jgi:hypothetical protein
MNAHLLLQHIWNKLVFAKSRAVGWHKVSAEPTVLRGESDTHRIGVQLRTRLPMSGIAQTRVSPTR